MPKWKCLLGSHDLVAVTRYTRICVKLKCRRCGKQYAFNSDIGAILRWDIHLENFYEKELPKLLEGLGLPDEYQRIDI
jgi:hypothetical protein